MGFNAVVVERDAEGRTRGAVRTLDLDDLPDGEVTVAVEYSTVNYKDGLCLGPGAGLVRKYPHVPGIDFAGRVEASSDPRYRPGDPVVLTGWRVGEAHWGGYAQKARVRADWLVPLPDGPHTAPEHGDRHRWPHRDAGDHGARGPTASCPATARSLSPAPPAASARSQWRCSRGSATRSPPSPAAPRPSPTCANSALHESSRAPTSPSRSPRPLESEAWAGCVDAVGGAMLSRVMKQLKYRAADRRRRQRRRRRGAARLSSRSSCVASASSASTVRCNPSPSAKPPGSASSATSTSRGSTRWSSPPSSPTSPTLGAAILKGGIRGRVVVDVNG